MHFALLIIFTNLSMATLPSLGHPSEWSTLPRNELNPSARTQVPCAQYFSFAHLRMAAAVPFFTFHFSTFEKANLVLHNPVLHLPQPLLFFRVAQCHHSSHKVFEVFHVLERVQSGFSILEDWKINRISSTIWSYVKVSESDPFDMRSPWLGRWEGFPVALQQSKLTHSKWNTAQVHEIPAVFKGNFGLTTVDTV